MITHVTFDPPTDKTFIYDTELRDLRPTPYGRTNFLLLLHPSLKLSTSNLTLFQLILNGSCLFPSSNPRGNVPTFISTHISFRPLCLSLSWSWWKCRCRVRSGAVVEEEGPMFTAGLEDRRGGYTPGSIRVVDAGNRIDEGKIGWQGMDPLE